MKETIGPVRGNKWYEWAVPLADVDVYVEYFRELGEKRSL